MRTVDIDSINGNRDENYEIRYFIHCFSILYVHIWELRYANKALSVGATLLSTLSITSEKPI